MTMYEQGKNALASGDYKRYTQWELLYTFEYICSTLLKPLWLRIDALDQLHQYEDVASATLAQPGLPGEEFIP